MISLPMTKTAFKAIEEKYIASVATTAGVTREKVKILSVDEVSTRSSSGINGRLLLATSVYVQTSVLVPLGQQTSLQDQKVLNSNLNKNGLPSGALVVQYKSYSTTTPMPGGSATPKPLDSAASASTSSSVQLYMILCIVLFHLQVSCELL